MRILLLLLLLITMAIPALARTPEETVKKVYESHLTRKSFQETLSQCEDCFTAGFLSVMQRALARKPGTSSFVDFDFFVNSQAGFAKFEVGQASVDGKKALVPIRIWNDSRGYDFEKDPARRKAMASPALIHLVDVGKGLQITDIEFIGFLRDRQEGGFSYWPGQTMRPILEKIAQGR